MLDAPVNTFDGTGIEPIHEPEKATCLNINLPPSVTYSKGQVLGQITSSANAVQTVTISGSPTGGTFTLTGSMQGYSQTTAAIAYNASAADVQTALRALTIFGPNLSVSGSGPYVVTFNGTLAGTPIPVMTASGALLTGGSSPSVAVANTTVGRSAGTFVAYDGTLVTPTTAPTVAGNGSGSSFAAGTYAVQYTYVTAHGESTPSPATNVTATAAQNLRVSALSSLNSAITHVRYYVNGTWHATTAVSSGTAAQTDLTGATLATAGSPPTVNTAFTAPNGAGSHIPRAILRYSCATDTSGYATYGTVAGSGEYGEAQRAVPAWFGGSFKTSELTGLTARAVSDWLGKLISGTVADGILRF